MKEGKPQHPLRRAEDQVLRMPGSERLREKVRSLSELLEVSRQLNSTLDLQTILSHLINISTDVLKAEEASILLLDERTGELIFRVTRGEAGKRLEGMRLAPGEGIAGQCVVEERMIIANDVAAEPKHSRRFDEVSGLVTRSVIAVPLCYHERLYGVLEIINLTAGYLRKEDVERVESVASIAAQAVANARLLDEHRKQQAELVQAGKLAAIGTIAAGVAHELNQPLTGIRAYTQMILRSQAKGSLTEQELRDRLNVIDSQVGRMTRIIDHLRIFARQSRLELGRINLNRVVYDAFILLDEQLRNQGIRVVKELAEIPDVRGDSVRIEEVVLNLVTNARDAMDGVNLPTLLLRTWHDAALHTVCLSVKDSGHGIPEDVRSRIFDPFFTTKEPGKGTGLGLSISHGIIEEHHGRIIVESEAGRGTTFIISLPEYEETQ